MHACMNVCKYLCMCVCLFNIYFQITERCTEMDKSVQAQAIISTLVPVIPVAHLIQ